MRNPKPQLPRKSKDKQKESARLMTPALLTASPLVARISLLSLESRPHAHLSCDGFFADFRANARALMTKAQVICARSKENISVFRFL